MTGLSRQKQKLLTMKKLFETRTDEKHTITGNRLIEILGEYGIKAERKTIYDDIKTLCDSGMDIEITKDGHSNAYYLAKRLFQDEELYVLADAVASCRFLTQKKSKELIRKIQSLTSEYKAKDLRRMVYVSNRTKTFNEQIYYAINKIQEGIFNGVEIRFKYFEYTVEKRKQLKHGGEVYTVSPYSLVWENDNYYLVCYCEKHEKICRYRVDRMTQVSVTDLPRRELSDEEKAEAANQQSIYGMYGGELMTMTLQFDNSLINVVMDRFGERTICHKNSDDTFYINQEIQVAPTFWGWLFQFGSKAKVLGPEPAVNMAKAALKDIESCYE
ncbi:WYL domain-containing protein [Ruminococcus sp.]|uniref:helix-turn-helix transcriptional regulator n=1 Tax=Ruminococcus sp. TaxID=41978 RepID=UPI0025DD91CF|nr:WYL domain-containing protein [Ruminococcus sp.]